MRRRLACVASVAALLAAGCSLISPPTPPPPAVAHSHPQPPADWFQQQLVTAREAKRAHQPKSDTAGAQAAYDEVLGAACTRLALSGPDTYRAQCDAVLQQPKPQTTPLGCENAEDPIALAACND